jgi:hypothetical protein
MPNDAVSELRRMLRNAGQPLNQPTDEQPEQPPTEGEPRSVLMQRLNAALEVLVPTITRPWRDRQRD